MMPGKCRSGFLACAPSRARGKLMCVHARCYVALQNVQKEIGCTSSCFQFRSLGRSSIRHGSDRALKLTKVRTVYSIYP